MTHARTSALLTTLAALLGACSSTPTAPPAAPMSTANVAAAPATTPRPMASSSNVATVTLPAYLDPKSRINTERSVYFDYDDFAVEQNYRALIERHASFLASKPALAIKIEGNSDERGGAEYNLALGQKRADAVLRSLKIYGVKESQMEAVSWGEGKPKASGHDETAWAQNRRADLQYPAR
ncbi:MAG: peptidoglycan-associated lipoprotein Pal [Burkholderiales bacterium]